jgi:hypothetical protein
MSASPMPIESVAASQLAQARWYPLARVSRLLPAVVLMWLLAMQCV